MASRSATTGVKPPPKGTHATVGTPTTLDRPVPLHAEYLPMGEAIAKLVRTGMPVKEAAQSIGVDPGGAYRCLGDGRTVAGLIHEGRLDRDQLTEFQQQALQYFTLVDAAEAEALAIHASAIARHAQGGNVRKRTVTTYDEKGNKTGTQVIEEVLPPDVRASTFWLERRRPDLFGRTERREHALVGGDATVGTASPREKLAEVLAQIARRKEQGAGVMAAMGVIDVDEVLDDDEGAASA